MPHLKTCGMSLALRLLLPVVACAVVQPTSSLVSVQARSVPGAVRPVGRAQLAIGTWASSCAEGRHAWHWVWQTSQQPGSSHCWPFWRTLVPGDLAQRWHVQAISCKPSLALRAALVGLAAIPGCHSVSLGHEFTDGPPTPHTLSTRCEPGSGTDRHSAHRLCVAMFLEDRVSKRLCFGTCLGF